MAASATRFVTVEKSTAVLTIFTGPETENYFREVSPGGGAEDGRRALPREVG